MNNWHYQQSFGAPAPGFPRVSDSALNAYKNMVTSTFAQAMPSTAPARPFVHNGTNPNQSASTVVGKRNTSHPPDFPRASASVQNAYNNIVTSTLAQAMPPTAPARPVICNGTNPTQGDSTVVGKKNTSHPEPKATTASYAIKLTNSNRDDIAKLPVAFGFWHGDRGASKNAAQTATKKWVSNGEQAVKLKSFGGKGGANKKNNNSTPKGVSTNSSPDPQTPSCNTPKAPRTPAVLVSTKAEPSLPLGWTTKIFRRASGKTAGGTDTYYYSPQNQIKFRSMTRCKQFIQILNEPGIDGKETDAASVLRERNKKI